MQYFALGSEGSVHDFVAQLSTTSPREAELDFTLTDKVAIVTGAAPGGIGEAYARALAEAGARVVVADVRGDEVRETAGRLSADGHTSVAAEVDITDPESAAAMAEIAKTEFGGIDVLVNNAALMMQIPRVPLSEFPLDWWDRVMKVNVAGALICIQAVVPTMIERGGGSIINQSSAGAFYNWAPYGVSKLALVGLTYGLARELGKHNIRVNAIAPGSMQSQAVLDSVGGADSLWWETRMQNQSLLTTALAAMAVATERVRLWSHVVNVPMHPVAFLAKRTATIDVLSGGRYTMTAGIGGRPQDWLASEKPYVRYPHARMDGQIAELRRMWRGAPPADGGEPVLPLPAQAGGPPILCSSQGPKGLARAARWADGYAGFISERVSDPDHALGFLTA